jgi:glycosyltransferase involved in cell wall biosynthesis
MGNRQRILFLADGHSVHTHGWLRLLEGTEWEVHASVGGAVPPCPIEATFHTLDAKAENPAGNRVKPWWPWRRGLSRVYRWRFGHGHDAESRRHAALIRKLRPSIVHSLRIQHEGYVALGAIDAIRSVGASWFVSLWGSDLYHFGAMSEHRDRIRAIVQQCDFVIPDCARDFSLAREFGATDGQFCFDRPIPTSGGVDVSRVRGCMPEPDPAHRQVLLFPKARADRFHRFLPIVEAIRKAAAPLTGFDLVFVGVNGESRRAIETLPTHVRERCVLSEWLPHEAMIERVAAARAVIAPSVSDGTPNVMLEAMAGGALPVFSPLESITEWIDDGVNGLLADNDDADALAAALMRAATDDDFTRAAAAANLERISGRADRARLRSMILDAYACAARGERPRGVGATPFAPAPADDSAVGSATADVFANQRR